MPPERYTPIALQSVAGRRYEGYDEHGRYVGVQLLPPFAEPKLADPKAVKIKSGWVGQVIFRDEIVKEEQDFSTQAEAIEWATNEIDNALRNLFA